MTKIGSRVKCCPIVFSVSATCALGAVTKWNTNFDGVWNTTGNWDNGTPTSSDDAEHETKLSSITVDFAGDEAKSFKGNIQAPDDRFMVIGSDKLLTIGSDGMTGTVTPPTLPSSGFKVYLKDGTSSPKTRVSVGGDVAVINFLPARNHSADYAKITIGGSVSNYTAFTLGDSGEVDIDGSVDGADFDLGNSALVDVAGGVQDAQISLDSGTFNVGTSSSDDLSSSTVTLGAGSILDVTGDMLNTPLTLADEGSVEVDGAAESSSLIGWTIGDDASVTVSGNIAGIGMLIGTDSATDQEVTSMQVGSIGDPDPIAETWTLNGYADLSVTGNYEADGHHILFEMNDHAEMNVGGTTTSAFWKLHDHADFSSAGQVVDGKWEMYDDSEVTLNGGFAATENSGSYWKLFDNAEFTAVGAYEVNNAEWLVGPPTKDGPPRIEVLTSSSEFNPKTLKVQGGEVEVQNLGFDADGTPQNPAVHPVWDMELNGSASVLVHHEGWHEEDNSDSADNAGSKITYDNLSNVYKVLEGGKGINISGPVVRADSGAELRIEIDGHETQHDGYLDIESAIVLDVSSTMRYLNMDAEGVTLWMTEGYCSADGHLEPFSPDYVWYGDPVVFQDSKCVHRWSELKIINDTGTSDQCVQITNNRTNHPINGNDAVYVKNLTVESGALLRGGSTYTGPVNVYYTNSLSCAGGSDCTSSPSVVIWENGTGFVAYQPILANPSYYGDFDGDQTALGQCDSDDIGHFNDAFPDDQGEANYKPLIDWNCDSKLNCEDYCHFLENYTTGCGTLESLDDEDGTCSCP